MAKEIQCVHTTSGATLYAQILNSVGQAWNFNGFPNAFETYQTANYGDYDLALTELGTASKVWAGDMPATIPVGVYSIIVRVQAGGGPAESDSFVTAGQIYWNGTTVVYLGTPQTGDAYLIVSNGTHGNAALLAYLGSLSTTVAAVPAAVWLVGTRTLTSFGTLVADAAAAVWAYATRTLSALAWIRWTSPLSPGGTTITTIQGDTYLAADGPIPTWTILLEDIDLTSATVVERIKPVGSDVITFNATVTDAGETEQTVTLPFATAAETLSIPVGTWDMDLVAFMPGDSHPKFLRQGKHVSKKSTYTA